MKLEPVLFAVTITVIIAVVVYYETKKALIEYGKGFDAGVSYQKQENYRRGVMTKKYKWLDKYKLAR